MAEVARQSRISLMSELFDFSRVSDDNKQRVPFLDTVFVKGLVWLSVAFVLVAPIIVPRLVAIAQTDAPIPADMRPVANSEDSTDSPSIEAASRTYVSDAEFVPDRLAAILGVYRPSPDDFDLPSASSAQASAALQWCAHRVARYERTSFSNANTLLMAALRKPRSSVGAIVVSALEQPALGNDERRRIQCAALLYSAV